MKEKATFEYHFKNKKVRSAFKIYAIEQGKSIQKLIHEALKEKYPKLIK